VLKLYKKIKMNHMETFYLGETEKKNTQIEIKHFHLLKKKHKKKNDFNVLLNCHYPLF
jgi:hypothetical protein